MKIWLAVFLGGGVGSVARYAISRLVLTLGTRTIFPWATFISNLLATALLAWLIWRWQQPEREAWQAFMIVGFCGGFSTMSTFSMENHQLIHHGWYMIAALNIGVTVTLGILLFHYFARVN